MRRAWTVAAAAALLFAGVALTGCKCSDDAGGSGGGAAATSCADCKAAGGTCAACAGKAK